MTPVSQSMRVIDTKSSRGSCWWRRGEFKLHWCLASYLSQDIHGVFNRCTCLKHFINEFGMWFWNLGGGRHVNKTSITVLGPLLENSRDANTKSGSGNVILQRHLKCKDCDKSVVHFEVSELQKKLVVHGIISMSLLIYSGCSLFPTEQNLFPWRWLK